MIYSLIETARVSALDLYTWLRRVLLELPAAQSVEAIEALLPRNLHRKDVAGKMTLRTVFGLVDCLEASPKTPEGAVYFVGKLLTLDV